MFPSFQRANFVSFSQVDPLLRREAQLARLEQNANLVGDPVHLIRGVLTIVLREFLLRSRHEPGAVGGRRGAHAAFNAARFSQELA